MRGPAYGFLLYATVFHVCDADVRDPAIDFRSRLKNAIGDWSGRVYPLLKKPDGETGLVGDRVAKCVIEKRFRQFVELSQAIPAGRPQSVGMIEYCGDAVLFRERRQRDV
ncbi:hypothetical protein A7G45_18210 [Mycolicibacterium llatzerense]|nr:hypothetical protein [Mycolicibacterium llatzerense]